MKNYEELKAIFGGGDGTAKIAVVGIGGGGNNSVSHMLTRPMEGVSFFVANTDIQSLARFDTHQVIPLGANLTKGLGSGGDPLVGQQAAIESREAIEEALKDFDVVFLTCGLGGGTGSGAIREFGDILKSLGILTIAVITKPFKFEGTFRTRIADAIVDSLAKSMDSVIVVPNDKLLTFLSKEVTLLSAFSISNQVLDKAVRGMSSLITEPGLINVDLADIYSITRNMGYGVMSTGTGTGELRAKNAIMEALHSPLLSDTELNKVKGMLVNIRSGLDLKLSEFEQIGVIVSEYMSEDTKVVLGTSIDTESSDEFTVTIIFTGMEAPKKKNVAGTNNAKLFIVNEDKKGLERNREEEDKKSMAIDEKLNILLKKK
jgi:cell division protein FtsZ